MADSTVTIIGNTTRDPELSFTGSGTAVAKLGVAVSRRYQQNGEWQEKTSFFNVTAWGQLGENVAASVAKGTRVVVTGRLEQRTYEDREGNERNVVEIVADDVAPSLRFATADVHRIARGSDAHKAPAADEEPF